MELVVLAFLGSQQRDRRWRMFEGALEWRRVSADDSRSAEGGKKTLADDVSLIGPSAKAIVAPEDGATGIHHGDRVGQAFERIYLTTSAQSIGLQPLSQAVQVPAVREELSGLLPAAAGIPQQPFRLGYANRVLDHTPRRPLSEVLR